MIDRAESLERTGEKQICPPTGKSKKRRGFFNAIANRLASARLGDLLVDSGLISRDQLDQALSIQRQEQKKLGQVLVEIGAISTVALYRKLAEQWTIKTTAAGLTMLVSMGSMAPRTASAQGFESANVSFSASATTTKDYALDNISFPAMFGAPEVKSSDISGFKNWTGVLARFQRDMANPNGNLQLAQLQSKLSKYKNMSLKDKVVGVNTLLNARPYVEDTRNYGKTDYWATPVEFMQRGGDCEDYAIAKYASLRALGVPAEQMRVAIVYDKKMRLHHAILIVYDTNNRAYVLDNQERAVKDLASVNRYKPIYSINQKNWWLHKKV